VSCVVTAGAKKSGACWVEGSREVLPPGKKEGGGAFISLTEGVGISWGIHPLLRRGALFFYQKGRISGTYTLFGKGRTFYFEESGGFFFPSAGKEKQEKEGNSKRGRALFLYGQGKEKDAAFAYPEKRAAGTGSCPLLSTDRKKRGRKKGSTTSIAGVKKEEKEVRTARLPSR